MYQDKALYINYSGAGASSWVDMFCDILEQADLEEVTGKWDPSRFFGEGGSYNTSYKYFNRSFKYGPLYFIPASYTKKTTSSSELYLFFYRPYTDTITTGVVSSGSYASGLGWQYSASNPYYMTVRLIKSDNLLLFIPLNNSSSYYTRSPLACYVDDDQNYHFNLCGTYRTYSKNGSKAYTNNDMDSAIDTTSTLYRGNEEYQVGALVPYMIRSNAAIDSNKLYSRFKRYYRYALPTSLSLGDRFMLKEYNYVVVTTSYVCYRI